MRNVLPSLLLAASLVACDKKVYDSECLHSPDQENQLLNPEETQNVLDSIQTRAQEAIGTMESIMIDADDCTQNLEEVTYKTVNGFVTCSVEETTFDNSKKIKHMTYDCIAVHDEALQQLRLTLSFDTTQLSIYDNEGPITISCSINKSSTVLSNVEEPQLLCYTPCEEGLANTVLDFTIFVDNTYFNCN